MSQGGLAIDGERVTDANQQIAATGLTADQPGTYLQDRAWTHVFGKVVNEQVEDYGHLISLRVHYENELEVEYGLAHKNWAAVPLDEGTHEVISSGIKVLFERSPLLSRHV